MQIWRVNLTPLQLAILLVVLAAFVVAFFPLWVSAASFIWSWVASNHSIIIACFGHGC